MKLLLHSCCGPCTIFPLERLKNEFDNIEVFFYNPNIHPYKEYKQRLTCLKDFLVLKNIPIITPADYNLNDFFQKVVFNENKRCTLCYEMRLDYCFSYAAENNFDAVTTTLLYSKYQNQQLIQKIAQKMSKKYGVTFYYEDFREGWQYGIDKSIEENMYRQSYCGCIYSEQERYDNKLKKKLKKESKNK